MEINKNSSEPLSPDGKKPTSAVSGIGTTIIIRDALTGVKKLNDAPFLPYRSSVYTAHQLYKIRNVENDEIKNEENPVTTGSNDQDSVIPLELSIAKLVDTVNKGSASCTIHHFGPIVQEKRPRCCVQDRY